MKKIISYLLFFLFPFTNYSQIVNVESLRNKNNKQFNGYIKIAYDFKKVNEVDWEMENEIFLNWNYKSWTIFLINEIKILEERIIDEKFVNYTISRNENEINIFFDKKDSNLIGWQILDIYQNLNITYIDIFEINKKINENEFKLPKPD